MLWFLYPCWGCIMSCSYECLGHGLVFNEVGVFTLGLLVAIVMYFVQVAECGLSVGPGEEVGVVVWVVVLWVPKRFSLGSHVSVEYE